MFWKVFAVAFSSKTPKSACPLREALAALDRDGVERVALTSVSDPGETSSVKPALADAVKEGVFAPDGRADLTAADRDVSR